MSHEKTKRNKEMYKKKLKGKTYRQLADHYNLDVRAVFDICKREEKKVLGVRG